MYKLPIMTHLLHSICVYIDELDPRCINTNENPVFCLPGAAFTLILRGKQPGDIPDRFMKLFTKLDIKTYLFKDGAGYFAIDDYKCIKIVYGEFGDFAMFRQGIVLIENLEHGLPDTIGFECIATSLGVVTDDRNLPYRYDKKMLVQLYGKQLEITSQGVRYRFNEYQLSNSSYRDKCIWVMGLNIAEGCRPKDLKFAPIISTDLKIPHISKGIILKFRGSNELLIELHNAESIFNNEIYKNLEEKEYFEPQEALHDFVMNPNFIQLLNESKKYIRISESRFLYEYEDQYESKLIANCTVLEKKMHPLITGNLQYLSQKIVTEAFVAYDNNYDLRCFYKSIAKLQYPINKPVVLKNKDKREVCGENIITWTYLLMIPQDWQYKPNLKLQLANRMFYIKKDQNTNVLEELEIKVPDNLEIPSNIEAVLESINIAPNPANPPEPNKNNAGQPILKSVVD